MSREEAAAMGVGGGAPVGLGGDGRAEELRDVEKKLARGWVGGEEERRRGLRVEVARRRATALRSDEEKRSSALRCDGGEAKTKSASTDGLSGGEWNGDAWNCR